MDNELNIWKLCLEKTLLNLPDGMCVQVFLNHPFVSLLERKAQVVVSFLQR